MNIKIILIFIIIALSLVWIWIPAGQIVGGGDVGMPTFLPQRALKIVLGSWWETQATGVNNPASFTAIPFYFFLSIFDILGVGPDLTQKGLLVLIMAGGAISIYLLAKEFEFGLKTSFLAGIFYIFNPISLSVFHRGVHNAMLMLLLMPLSLLIIVRGVKSKKYLSILWVNFISVLISYVYGTPAYIAVIWFLWLTFLLVKFKLSERKDRKFVITYLLVLFISWIGLNFWWLLHFLGGSRETVDQFSPEQLYQRSSDVVENLKVYTKPEYVLRGLNAYYHYGNLDWGTFYLSPVAILISWIPLILIFFTLLVRRNYKKDYWIFLIVLTAVVLFISKGVNAPWGGLNRLAYDNIAALAVLRNPYEKVGILLIIPYSLLFALGCSQIRNKLKAIVFLLAVSSVAILVWPLWRGEVFRTVSSKSYFEVPAYYKDANKWFEQNSDDTRVLHLPLAPGESVDYDWGYTGVEPSQLLFPGSSIAYSVGTETIDSKLRELLILVHNQDNVSLEQLLPQLNVGWVVVHNETIWRNRSLEPVERINSWLQTKPRFIEHALDFGPLSVWRIKDEYRLGHFFITNKLSDNNVVKPKASMSYSSPDIIDEKTAFDNLAEVTYLPDSLIYPLVIIKENILSFFNQSDSVINCFILSGKRLKEAALLYRQAEFIQANKGLVRYEKQINKCSRIGKDVMMRYMSVSGLKDLILGQLMQQKAVLDTEFKDVAVIKGGEIARSRLREYLTALGMTTRYDPVKLDINKRLTILQYFVPKEGDYSIKLEKPDQELIKTSPKIAQIDSELVDLSPIQVNADSVRFPSYKFSKGFHEIQLEVGFVKNLLDSQIQSKITNPDPGFSIETDPDSQQPTFTGQALSGLISLTFNLPDIKIGQNYKLFFDTFLDQGKPPFIVITHDNDPLDAAGNQPPAVKYQVEDPRGWGNTRINYTPTLNATDARLSLMLIPSETTSLLQTSVATKAKFKNIVFEKIPDNLVLEDSHSDSSGEASETNISWKKINPALYEVTLGNQGPPYTLVFSETFHNMWKVADSKGQVIDLPHSRVNGFANAWQVEKPLPQKVYIKFILQDTRNKGLLVSVASLFILIATVIILDRRRKSGV